MDKGTSRKAHAKASQADYKTQGTLALLGDASHPTLPYQGQGAAMAVEVCALDIVAPHERY